MNTKLTIFAVFFLTAFANGADKPIDLTGADATKFKSQLGHVVSLRGRLEQGMQGPCLFGATPTNVVFYVIPDVPTNGSYFYPETWERLMHQQVKLIGELKFRSFDNSKAGPFAQIAPDYYYMVLQRTTVERLESK